MTGDRQWHPPNWARLIAYLAGVAFFIVQPTLFPPPHFGLLLVDAVVLIGLQPEALRQLAVLVAVLFGRSPPEQGPSPSPPQKEDPT